MEIYKFEFKIQKPFTNIRRAETALFIAKNSNGEFCWNDYGKVYAEVHALAIKYA
jgi:hypothetical protein